MTSNDTKPILINICGPNFVGSTMLGAMLGKHSRAFHVGEVHFLFRPLRTWHLAEKNQPDQKIWEPVLGGPEEQFHAQLCDAFDVDAIVDSSKRISWVVDTHDWARQQDMRILNIVLWKNPLALAYSYWKRPSYLTVKRGLELSARYYERLQQLDVPLVSVQLSELLTAPQPILQRICDLCELPKETGLCEFWTEEPQHAFGNQGTREQMGTENGALRPPSDFSAEFKEGPQGDWEEFLSNSRRWRRIMQNLDAVKIGDIDSISTSPPRSIRKPFWYYVQRLRHKWALLRLGYR